MLKSRGSLYRCHTHTKSIVCNEERDDSRRLPRTLTPWVETYSANFEFRLDTIVVGQITITPFKSVRAFLIGTYARPARINFAAGRTIIKPEQW